MRRVRKPYIKLKKGYKKTRITKQLTRNLTDNKESNDDKGNANNSPKIQPEKKVIKRPKLQIKRKKTTNGKVDSDQTNEKHILLDDSESDDDDEVKKENQDILETVKKGHKIPHPNRVPKTQIIPNKSK